MRKFFLFLICALISLVWVSGARAGIQPRGPAVQPEIPVAEQSADKPATIQPPASAPTQSAKKISTQSSAAPVLQQNATSSDKEIIVSLENQDLTYFEGTKMLGEFKISSGLKDTPTPPGQYTVLKKKPVVDYKGPNYDFPNTKWNLMFKETNSLNYYIHGAYWHHNFGHPMSHGCVNVSYADMEPLYNWADVGTKIIIQ